MNCNGILENNTLLSQNGSNKWVSTKDFGTYCICKWPAAKAQLSLSIPIVSPEPSLLTHRSMEVEEGLV